MFKTSTYLVIKQRKKNHSNLHKHGKFWIVRVYDMKNPTHQGKLFCAKLLVQILVFKSESEVKYVTGTGTHALKRF